MTKLYAALIVLLYIILHTQCSFNTPVAGGSETTNTLVSFTVSYLNGEIPKHASVRVRPAEYLKSFKNSFNQELIKDLVVNEEGKVTIELLPQQEYFIEINDNKAYATLLKLQVPKDVKDTILPLQILEPFAKINGFIDSTINSEDSLLVEIMGLERSIKVAPNDSFSLKDIPASNNYTLKIISVKNKQEINTIDSINLLPNGVINLQISKNNIYYKTNILIDASATGANITKNLYNYPLLVRLNNNNFNFNQTNFSPNNILIIKPTNGDTLPIEIEQWDNELKQATLWVLVDTIYAQSITTLSLLWGADIKSSKSQVFRKENNFVGVWHFNDSSKLINAVDPQQIGTNFGTSIIPGVISNAYNYVNQAYSFLPAEAFSSIDSQVTISFWQYGINIPEKARLSIFDARENDTASMHILTIHMPWYNAYLASNAIYFDASYGDTLNCRIFKAATRDEYEGQWNYWTFIKDATKSQLYIYKNGELWASDKGDNNIINNINIVKIGNCNYSERNYTGYLDELRVSNSVRDSNWIKMNYETQKIGSSIVKIGIINQ